MQKEWIPRVEGINFPAILEARGIDDKDIPMFVDPENFANEVPPRKFAHLERAVSRVSNRLLEGGSILVVADVDADGVTSGAIIYNALWNCLPSKCTLEIVVGSGKQHGITQHLDYILDSRFDMVIACDSGSDEHETYDILLQHDIEVIILDHHGTSNPDSNTITVNPEIWPVPKSQLSGAGICLKFAEILEESRDIGYMPYDLATVGIIADMMDMRYEDNRAICAKGFADLRNQGIKAALQGYEFNATSIRFSIAPLVNAAQRMGKNELALELFLDTTSPERCKQIVDELKELKGEQKALIAEALSNIDIYDRGKYIVATIDRNDEIAGLSGLIANKIAAEEQKPTIFLQYNQDEEQWQGSIRSYGVSNFKSIINETEWAIAEGHEEAAGIRLKSELSDLMDALDDEMPDEQRQVIEVDAEIDFVSDLTLADVAFMDRINKVTGEGFEPITVMISGVVPDSIFAMGKKHTKIVCGDVTLLLWNDTSPVDEWRYNKWKSFDIIGEPTISRYRGKEEINVIINDIEYELEVIVPNEPHDD